MAERTERIQVSYSLEEGTGHVHRKKIQEDQIIEDRVVARYDAEKQILFFKNLYDLKNFKIGALTFLSENEMSVRTFQREDMDLDPPLTKDIPPRPKKNRLEGDKTDDVVSWYMKYRPNEFATRYGFLGTYTGKVLIRIPQWVPRPIDGQLEYRGEQRTEKDVVNAAVTLRKTHLTYTPDECVDWDDDDPNSDIEDDRPTYTPPAKTAGKGKQPVPRRDEGAED